MEQYEKPVMEVIELQKEDVILASCTGGETVCGTDNGCGVNNNP